MKIEKLIKIFKSILPEYEKAIKENYSYQKLIDNDLQLGICFKAWVHTGYSITDIINNHYKNFIITHSQYLFISPHYNYYVLGNKQDIKKTIIPRRDFLKKEIKRLQALKRKGYTHV